ncbi:MAG: cation-translocating P-type ATPase, partial [Clostridiales bacterium]|nr:cation-translocating P-type ATPase [Clostridiales bacterium]
MTSEEKLRAMAERMDQKSNKTTTSSEDTVLSIVCKNVFTYFNLVFAVIAILLIIARSYRSLTFLPIIIANTGIGIFQQLRSKKVLDNLNVLAQASYEVERNGEKVTVPMDQLQTGDIIFLEGGQQIPADAEMVSGTLNVNESLLTGEADEIEKTEGAQLMSGSFVVSGKGTAKLTAVGSDCYAAQLTTKAREIKNKKSELVKNIELIIKIAGIAIIPLGVALYVEAVAINHKTVSEAIVSMVGAIIGMIPEGLYLLLTVALALGAMYLAQKKVLLHDMRSIETLARVDVLCVDKTGTITSNEMSVTEVFLPGADPIVELSETATDPEESDEDEEEDEDSHTEKAEVKSEPKAVDPEVEKKKEIISRYIATVDDGNITMNALVDYFGKGEVYKDADVTPFTSKLKYSEVKMEDVTYRLGAPDILLSKEDYDETRPMIEAQAEHGLRVLVFAEVERSGRIAPVLFIALKNGIRKNAPETFEYFKKQGVEVKVISGDNPLTVSKIAHQVGIPHSDRYVDATTLEDDDAIQEAVSKYTIFGRVKPEQKKSIVLALKKNGLKVAMTGDGVNDILAMKEADCSIAMGNGSDAARQAAQVVLLDSDFSRMEDIVSRGRQIINNITRSATVFLFKNIFSMLLAICAIIATFNYPLVPSQISLVTLFNTGVPAFLLSLEPNTRKQKQSFFRRILANAGPAAFTAFFTIAALAFYGERNNINTESLGVIATFLLAIAAYLLLLHISRPFNKYRSIVVQLMFFGFFLFIYIPFTRDLYMMKGLNTEEIRILAIFALIEIAIIKVLMLVLEHVRKMKRLEKV